MWHLLPGIFAQHEGSMVQLNRPESAPIHAQVLTAAQRLCHPDDWTFRLNDVARSLSHLNKNSVRTHVVSRYCENAPANHAHRWPYFRNVARGVEVQPSFRQTAPGGNRAGNSSSRGAEETRTRSAIHVAVSESEGWYVAECLEVAVVTPGQSLDETMSNLRNALELHLDDEDLARTALSRAALLVVNYETPAFASG